MAFRHYDAASREGLFRIRSFTVIVVRSFVRSSFVRSFVRSFDVDVTLGCVVVRRRPSSSVVVRRRPSSFVVGFGKSALLWLALRWVSPPLPLPFFAFGVFGLWKGVGK